MVDYLLELLVELLLQILFMQSFRRLVDIVSHPLVMASCFGLIAGLVSLLLFRVSFIDDQVTQLSTLVVFPIVMGGTMHLLGQLYNKLGFKYSALDEFAPGYSFGLAMTLVRVIGTNI